MSTESVTPIAQRPAPARIGWWSSLGGKLTLPPAARNARLDTVRGLACLLLVAYHAVGSTSDGGLRFPADSWVHDVNAAIGYLRMPLFTFLSGYVYSRMPVDWAGLGGFLQKKAMRLLVPMVVVGSLFHLLRTYAPGVNDRGTAGDWPHLLFYPYAHLWYIQALMIIFIVVGLLEAAGLLQKYRGALAIFVVATLVFDLREFLPEFFSINLSAYLLPFFLSGLLLARFGKDARRAIAYPLGWLALCLVLAQAIGGQHDIDSALSLLIGTMTSFLLMRVTPSISWLAFIGYYSYTVYLYHIFGTAAARVALQSLGLDDRYLAFPLVVGAGIFAPIVLHLTVAPIPVVSRLLLGSKPSNRSGRFNADRETSPQL